MMKIARTLLFTAPLLFTAACGKEDKTSSATTRLDAVEVQEGTVSDNMILLDQAASDGTAIDNSVPVENNRAAPADQGATNGDAPVSGDAPAGADAGSAANAPTPAVTPPVSPAKNP